MLRRSCPNYSYADGTKNSEWECGRDGGREGEGKKRKTDRSYSFSHFHPMATNVFFLVLYTNTNGESVYARSGRRWEKTLQTDGQTDGRTRTREPTDGTRRVKTETFAGRV